MALKSCISSTWWWRRKLDRWENTHRRLNKKSWYLKDIKRYSFPHRTVDIWNELKEEVVTATNIHKFKEMLDIWRYGDRTLWALLQPCLIQLGKYTHLHTHTLQSSKYERTFILYIGSVAKPITVTQSFILPFQYHNASSYQFCLLLNYLTQLQKLMIKLVKTAHQVSDLYRPILMTIK